MNSIFDIRAQRDAEYRARKAANDRALGLKPGATPEQVHAAITKTAKPMRFEATCTCGTRVTGNGRKWRHDKQATDKHRAHPVGTLRQI